MAPAAAALRQVGGDNDPVADKANKDLTAHSKGGGSGERRAASLREEFA